MVRAEEELYSMLGLSVPDSGVKRSRSLVGLPSAGLSPPPLATRPALQRRSSLPGEATLIEAQNAMVADVSQIILLFSCWFSNESSGHQHSNMPLFSPLKCSGMSPKIYTLGCLFPASNCYPYTILYTLGFQLNTDPHHPFSPFADTL